MNATVAAVRRHAATARLRTIFAAIVPVVLFLFCGWAAFAWYQTINRILQYYSAVPSWDYWRVAAYLPSYQSFDVRVLWRQHNEHRIIFPEIVFATDALLFRCRQILPVVISFLSYFGSWLALAWTFWCEKDIHPLTRKIGILLAGIIIGWQGSAAVLANAFLLQWTLTQIAVLLSLVFLTRVAETKNTGYLAAAIVSAVVATYSSGNGILVWSILVAAALLLSLSRRQVITLIIAAVLSIGLYFVGYRFTRSLGLANLFRHPAYSIESIASYLSMPFGGMKSAQFGVGVGLAALCIVLCLSIAAAQSGVLRTRTGIVLFGSYAFTILTAMVIAAARMNVSDPGFASAKAPRYLVSPLVAWGVFILLCVWFSSKSRVKGLFPATVFIVALLLIIGLPKLRWWLQARNVEQANIQLAGLALGQGFDDPNLILKIFPDPISASAWSRPLHDLHLSVFDDRLNNWLGRPVREFGPMLNASVAGTVTSVFPVISGLEIAGWDDETQLRGLTGRVVFANENGEIIGYGRKLPAGFPPALISPVTPPSLGWVGFAHLNVPVKSFSTYLVHKRGLVKLESAMPVLRDRAASPAELGSAISGIEWQIDGTWTPNLIPPRVNFGPTPDGGFYASWSGDDANTGQITSSAFSVPANRCVIVPLLNGPVANGLSAQLIDADTNEVVTAAPFQNGARWWTFWRVSIPESIKRLRVLAEDRGRGWGEWLAIGEPHQCR